MYPGFVSIRCGKTQRHGNDCHEGRNLYSQIPRNRRHGMPWKVTKENTRAGQKAEEQAEMWARAFIVVSMGSNGQGRVSRLNRFWNVQTTAQLHSSHKIAKQCSKFSKPGFNSTWTMKFQIFKLDLEKEAHIRWIIEKARQFQKNIYFCFIDYAKGFDCVDNNKLWKILRGMGIPDHLTCLLRNLCRSGSNS